MRRTRNQAPVPYQAQPEPDWGEMTADEVERLDRMVVLMGLLLVRRLVRHAGYPTPVGLGVTEHVNDLIRGIREGDSRVDIRRTDD